MKILYGDDVSASREVLYKIMMEAKATDKEVIELDGRSVDLTSVKQAFETQSLFGSDRLVVIENVLSGQQSVRKKEIVSYLQQCQSDELVIWEGQTVRLGKAWSKGVGQEFKLPQALFSWLDGMAHGSAKANLNLYQEVAKTQSPEMLMVMMSRRLRQLWMVKTDKVEVLEKVEKQRDWQIRKLQKQAGRFSANQLTGLLDAIVAYDLARKSGESVRTLEMKMELWMVRM